MQKIKNESFSNTIKDAKLYLEDIEEIIEKLSSKSLNVKMYDNKNIYENINEVIEQKGKNPIKLIIEGKGTGIFQNINVHIEKNEIWVHSIGSELMYSYGIEINEFIKSKRVWYFYILNKNLLFINSFFLFALFQLLIDKSTKLLIFPWLIWVFIVLFSLLFFAIIVKYFWSSLSLVRRHEYGFFRRNKDSIILTIISAIMGSLLTILIQYLTGGK